MAIRFSVDFGLLKRNASFRALFVARMMSVFALGILNVAVPVQIHAMTGTSFPVSLAIALDGVGTFIGLLAGGIAADRHDRRRLILAARSLCGIGFLILALNGFLGNASLWILYTVAFWDGFFGGISMTALMAAFPALVGDADMAAAGALSMLTTRAGAVLAPLVGGLLIASAGVNWNYLLAGTGTVATVIPLFRLPTLLPDRHEKSDATHHPIRALIDGFRFLGANPLVAGVIAIGTLQGMCSAIRVLFPALASGLNAGSIVVGGMYAAIPTGAMLGALFGTSFADSSRPTQFLIGGGTICCLLVALLGVLPHVAVLLAFLIAIGGVGSITTLLQFTLVQRHTPDYMRGRVGALWNMQDVIGDSVGTVLLGSMVGIYTLPSALGGFGIALAVACIFTGILVLLPLCSPTQNTSHHSDFPFDNGP